MRKVVGIPKFYVQYPVLSVLTLVRSITLLDVSISPRWKEENMIEG